MDRFVAARLAMTRWQVGWVEPIAFHVQALAKAMTFLAGGTERSVSLALNPSYARNLLIGWQNL
jgi:hypothetical protein